ncbi:helix-turn-helix domain-containing protein, partial [Escherichia coli]|nr:helix-turn-helix domain-containing protein [Escherichia coli]
PQNDVTLKMPAFEWVHVQLHQQKGMISLSPPTICNSARGKRLGRQAGVRPKSDRLLPKVVAMRAEGRSYRWIARELGISKNTVADIVQRHRANA